MAALSAVLALGLLAYVPGRFLLRLLVPPNPVHGRNRLLHELLLGNAVISLVGLLVAELGVFSLAAVIGVLSALTAIAALGGRKAGRFGYGVADVAGLVCVAATLAWVMPPFDTSLYGIDSSVYRAAGLSLSHHGTLVFADPTVSEMASSVRRDYFPSYGRDPNRPPFIRLAGGLLLTSLDKPFVLPAFHTLLSVWVAIAHGLAGDAGLAAPAPYFAALALWSVLAFAYRLSESAAATTIAAAMLFLSAPQYWYSRFLMPEVPSQYFLWAGLVAAGESFMADSGLLGAVAGVGLGMSGLMRLDNLGHIIAALALWKAFVPVSAWPAGRGFAPAFLLVSAWAIAHQLLFPTHYYAEAAEVLEHIWTLIRPFLPVASITIVLLALVWFLSYRRRQPLTRSIAEAISRVGGVSIFGAYVAATVTYAPPDPGPSLQWLVLYVGWPALAAAAFGAAAWIDKAGQSSERFALLFVLLAMAQLLYYPHVTPAPLWAVRRFVPAVLPGIFVAAALAVALLASVRRWAPALGLLVLLWGVAGRTAFNYRSDAYQDASTQVQALAALLPPEAVVVFDPKFALMTQMHIALWSVADTPTYLLGADMRDSMLKLRNALPKRPLYWLGTANDAATSELVAIADPIASYRFGLRTHHVDWYDPRDFLLGRDVTVALYRLHPADPAAPLH